MRDAQLKYISADQIPWLQAVTEGSIPDLVVCAQMQCSRNGKKYAEEFNCAVFHS